MNMRFHSPLSSMITFIRPPKAKAETAIEQECAEAQRKRTCEFVGTFRSFSFHLPPDDPSAPLRSPVKSAFPDEFTA